MEDLKTEEMMFSMGPQHPSTHGVLRLEITSEGEVVKKVVPEIGFLHRCFEKHAESIDYLGIIPFVDRMDYLSAMNNEHGYCMGVESLMNVTVPERAETIRVIVCELNRIASHLMFFGTYGLDLGAFTPFMYALRDREIILDIFEQICGARLLYNYIRPGGIASDISDGSIDLIRDFLKIFQRRLIEYDELLTSNSIFIDRTAHVGVITKEQALDYGLTGPILRATGFSWDLRKNRPYSVYDRFSFNICVGVGEMGTRGDCYDRFSVRMREMFESAHIVSQAIQKIPSGDIKSKMPRHIKPPVGEVFSRVENPRGELCYYIVSDGSLKPARVKVKSPCFLALSALPELCNGVMLADLVAIVGSMDVVMGEVDR